MDVKKHALYQLNRTDIFDVMHNVKATTQRFEILNGELFHRLSELYRTIKELQTTDQEKGCQP